MKLLEVFALKWLSAGLRIRDIQHAVVRYRRDARIV